MLDAVRDIPYRRSGYRLHYKLDYAHRAFWSRVHALGGTSTCIAPAAPLDTSCPQDPAYIELQPSLQVEEHNQRTDLDFSQPVVGATLLIYHLPMVEVCYASDYGFSI